MPFGFVKWHDINTFSKYLWCQFTFKMGFLILRGFRVCEQTKLNKKGFVDKVSVLYESVNKVQI